MKRFLSIILVAALLVGIVPMNFVSKASTDSDMTLLYSTGDTIPWTAYDSTTYDGSLESSTVTLDFAMSITKLRVQITKVSSWNKYKFYEVEILDTDGNNIAGNASVQEYGSTMTTKSDKPVSYLNDGYDYGEKITSGKWSYFQRQNATTKTPTDEYIEFTFAEAVKVSQIRFWCNYSYNGKGGGDAPLGYDIYGNPSDETTDDNNNLTLVGKKKDIQWASNDETVESQSVVFDTPISVNALRLSIDEINEWKNYSIIELEIFDADGQNIEDDAIITVSDTMVETNLSYLTDNYKNGNWSKYDRTDVESTTPTNEYFHISFSDVVKVKEVKIHCWYGGSALTAFSVYASIVNPTLVFFNDEYQVNEEEKIVHQISAGTTAFEFLNQIDSVKLLGNNVKLTTQDGTLITDEKSTTNLTTGTKVVVYDAAGDILSYDIAVFGDVDRDGEATIADTVLTKQYEDGKVTLETLQQYAAGHFGTCVLGEAEALQWYEANSSVPESAKIALNTIPKDITKLRVYITNTGKYKKYSITEIKLYDKNGTNVAKDATVNINSHMKTENLDWINDGYENYWSTYNSNDTYTTVGLTDDYFEFVWNTPVSVCNLEMICFYGTTNAPISLDVRYEFEELSIANSYVNSVVLRGDDVKKQSLYSDAYYAEIAGKVANHENTNTLSLGFITDTHIDDLATYGYPSLLHLKNATRLANLANLDGLVHGGDLIDGNYVKNKSMGYINQAVSTLIQTSEVPVFMTQGNHDDNSLYLMNTEALPDEHIKAENWYWSVTRNLEQYGIVQNPDEPYGNYYYKDFEDSKIRVLFVNTNDLPYVLNEDGTIKYLATNGDFAIGDKQLNWIANTALNFADKGEDASDWAVLVMSHVYLYKPNDTTNQPCKNAWALTDMLEAFEAGNTYTSTSSDGDFAYSVSVDFSSQGAMDVIACIAGHNHLDLNAEVNGIPYITTAASLANQRPYGTMEEDAFDIYTIDRMNKKIYATRFGAGQDREFDY